MATTTVFLKPSSDQEIFFAFLGLNVKKNEIIKFDISKLILMKHLLILI